MVLPTYACREATLTAAVKTAVNGIGACAPEDSDVAVTLSVCASEQTIWLAFINQIKVAFCYIFGQITDILAVIADLPANHTGTPTVAAGAAAGTAATLTLLDGSSDTQGAIAVTIGSSPTAVGGTLAVLTFGTSFTSPIFPVVGIANDTAQRGLIPKSTVQTSGPYTALAITAQFPLGGTGVIGEGDTLILTYRVGYTA